MEIKEKMFVRFKNNNIQYIGKIININEFREPCLKYAVEVSWYDDYIFIGEKDIIKADYNLINLIEVGDYVNSYKILFFDKDLGGKLNIKCINNDEERICFYEEDIKDIVTKEQFESCKYVIERSNNEK